MKENLDEILKNKCTEIGKVYETKNYDIFNEMPFNRTVSQGRLKTILTSLEERILPVPIAVNENLEILDGQGRLEAFKKIGAPIPFVIIKDVDITDCIRLNRTSTKWKNADHIESFAEQGNENYIELVKCQREVKLTYERIIELSKPQNGTKRHETIATGQLIFTKEHTKIVKQKIKMANEIFEALPIERTGKNREFLNAVFTMFDHKDYDHKWMLKKCRQTVKFKTGRTKFDTLEALSKVYNYNSRRELLHFEDLLSQKTQSTCDNVASYDDRQKDDQRTTIGGK